MFKVLGSSGILRRVTDGSSWIAILRGSSERRRLLPHISVGGFGVEGETGFFATDAVDDVLAPSRQCSAVRSLTQQISRMSKVSECCVERAGGELGVQAAFAT